jgi:hypothetical protein
MLNIRPSSVSCRQFVTALILAAAGLFALAISAPSSAVASGSGAGSSAVAVPSTVKFKPLGLRDGRVNIMGKVTVAGTLKPYRSGQRVVVRFFHNATKFKKRVVKVRKGDGNFGVFKTPIYAKKAGKYAAQAVYFGQKGSDPISPDSTIRKSWKVRFTALRPGQCGRVIRAFRKALNDLAMVPSNNTCFDGKMQRAVLAYRKLNALGRSPVASKSVVRKIFKRQGAYVVRKPGLGNHMEAPLSRQVLVFAKGKRPYAIFPIASGAPATPTILGTYSVYWKDPGYNSLGMYYSSYFIRGYAIHGYKSVPNYPASHGCLRTFIADQTRIYDLTFVGQPIYLYGNARSANPFETLGYDGLDPARFDPPS